MMKIISIILILPFFFANAISVVAEPVYAQNQTERIYLPLVVQRTSPPVLVVNNGDFEAGRTGWVEYENSPFFNFPLIVQAGEMPPPIKPYNGAWAAWLGGDSDLLTYIEQQVTIPQSNPVLDYWCWIDSISDCDSGVGGVTLEGTFIDQYQLCTATITAGWVNRTVNLSSYAGQTLTLRILSQTGTGNYSSLFIDAVSIYNAP